MLHVFDDCAHEHYQRTLVGTEEGHHEHSAATNKRRVEMNKQAGLFKKFKGKK
jgi:hypothetical protein